MIDYLNDVKKSILSSFKLHDCGVDVYIEPSISSIVFFINADGYKHIFKAPIGLVESKLTSKALAEIIIDEVKEWRDKLNED